MSRAAGNEAHSNGVEKQEIGRRGQVGPPVHSYLKHREHQQTQLSVIANLCPSFAVGMCGQSPNAGMVPL